MEGTTCQSRSISEKWKVKPVEVDLFLSSACVRKAKKKKINKYKAKHTTKLIHIDIRSIKGEKKYLRIGQPN